MKAIRAIADQGTYTIYPDLEQEAFEDIKPDISKINSIEPLTGWDRWSHVISFTKFNDEECFNFLEGNPFINLGERKD
ncbi:MAG: hypothetical protein ACMUJM_12595 [bacterium]